MYHLTAITLLSFVFTLKTAHAEQARGPTLQVEYADSEPSHSEYRSVQRTRGRLYGLLPLKTSAEGSNLYLSLDVMRELRRHRATDGRPTTNNLFASEGLLYMYKWPGESFVPLLWLTTFQAPGLKNTSNRMDQLVFGFTSRHKMPLFPQYRGRTTVGYRLRWYPSHKNYLLYVGEEIFSDTFWQILISTAGGRLDFFTPDQDLWGYIGYEGDARDYFGRWYGEEVWKIGSAVTGYLGFRKRIAGILYGALDVGFQSEKIRHNTPDNELRLSYQTHYTPWVRAAIETWVDVKVQ
ncbi:MAG: hypothetical protein RL011_2480 [Pseudomonadota bacterium]